MIHPTVIEECKTGRGPALPATTGVTFSRRSAPHMCQPSCTLYTHCYELVCDGVWDLKWVYGSPHGHTHTTWKVTAGTQGQPGRKGGCHLYVWQFGFSLLICPPDSVDKTGTNTTVVLRYCRLYMSNLVFGEWNKSMYWPSVSHRQRQGYQHCWRNEWTKIERL